MNLLKQKHFSEMTEPEVNTLICRLEEAAVDYFQVYGFSGLSHAGWFSIYVAIQEAIRVEWLKAKLRKPVLDEEVIQ